MNINAITSTNPNLSSPSTNAASQPSEKDLFLTLLVAQLKNQDPLEPQDGTAFVAQLAQFNSLDQLVGIRQAIDQLTNLMYHLGTQTNTTVDTKPDQGVKPTPGINPRAGLAV
jgi:flagellar basal-body rod modification protein FlgD